MDTQTKEKLTLEYLAPYSDKELNFIQIGRDDKTITMTGFKRYDEDEIWVFGQHQNEETLIHDVLPILRPMLDLMELRTAGEVMKELGCELKYVHEIWALCNGETNIKDVSYEAILVMCKNHIDFQGLVENGLAIDINTLKK